MVLPFTRSFLTPSENKPLRKQRRYISFTRGKTEEALLAVDKTLEWCEVAPVNRKVLDEARFANMSDFEDAVQAAAAKNSGIDSVVTRDKAGFYNSGFAL